MLHFHQEYVSETQNSQSELLFLITSWSTLLNNLNDIKNIGIEKNTYGPKVTLNSTLKGAPKLHSVHYPRFIVIWFKKGLHESPFLFF